VNGEGAHNSLFTIHNSRFNCAMPKRKQLPVALTIAGSDSGGGAGIQADLKTFAALGVHGASVITCVTAQNPKRVWDVEPCSPKIVRQQIEAVFEELRPGAVKTGMLFSAESVRVVASFFKKRDRLPLIIDPVMISTSGAVLLKPSAIKILETQLLPLATLVTPNLHEAGILTGRKIMSVENMRAAAREIHAHFGCAALVKGGHLRSGREAVDIFFDGRTEFLLTAPFVKKVRTHGTGCTYSAAIAGYLARGLDLPQAVKRAKEFVTQAIAQSRRVEKYFVLNHSPRTAIQR
jgi:hydroxymethylpyrimidine/phosphomethylpyrimidine kinase